MCRILYGINQKDGPSIDPPPLSLPSSMASASSSSSSFNKISPVLLLVIVILAVVFFVSGLLHLLVRFLLKRPAFSAIYHSNRYPETSESSSIQRQLQQLFRQHDSGLDQSFIDALPVFYYKDIIGLKEPFDCAVCLCEFSDHDKLRLLPMCSHAFHICCIDTWLLSNSTCPLCRGILLSSSLQVENPFSNHFHVPREVTNGLSGDAENVPSNAHRKLNERVFSVRLGKFRSLNEGGECSNEERGVNENSRCNLDARRCFSMGTVQYVVGDSDLRVTLFSGAKAEDHGCSSAYEGEDVEGKKIKGRTRGDSFSVSKIWLWTKKEKFPGCESTNVDVSLSSSVAGTLQINHRTEIVRDTKTVFELPAFS